jgi:hypothetical protein
MYGMTRPLLPDGIDEQAELFFQQGQLATVFLRRLIDSNAFAGPPNVGHSAVADLLLIHGIQTAITTNVDFMIETAGQLLLGHIGAGIDRAAIGGLPPTTAPLLKLHGCRHIDNRTTIWARGQLGVSPVAERISFATQWLATRLLDRDLLIVGCWTISIRRTQVSAPKQGTIDRVTAALCDAALAPTDPLAQLVAAAIIRDEHIASLSLDLKETDRYELLRSGLGSSDAEKSIGRAAQISQMAKKRVAAVHQELTLATGELSSASRRIDEVRAALVYG